MKLEENSIKKDIYEIKKRMLKMALECKKSAHLGGSLSMIDIVTILYKCYLKYDNNNFENRDRFILSKGHCAMGLYSVLAQYGIISDTEISTFLHNDSKLGVHPVMNVKLGIESSSGSLGQGVSMAAGIAYAAMLKNKDYKVYVLVGNGECNEGSVWEATMFAGTHKLNNLTIIVDNNRQQSDGCSDDIINLGNMSSVWSGFGFDVHEIDGHNEIQIRKAFEADQGEKPKVIIADTIKGHGISFMEGNNQWHHNRLTEKGYEDACKELESSLC